MTELDEKLALSRERYRAERRQLQRQIPSLRSVAGEADARGPATISRRLRYGSRGAEREAGLNTLYVEPLLQQAASLVERVLSEDPTYRQLKVDQTNLSLDLNEFQTLQAINDDEVAAGLFQLGLWEASSASASDVAVKQAQTGLISWIQGREEDQKRLAAWSTENAQQPLATGWENKLSKHTLKLFGGWTPPQIPSGTSATDGNIIGGNLSYQLAAYSLDYGQQQIGAQVAPIDARAEFVNKRLVYSQADAGFKERRRNAAHQKLVAKLSATLAPDGPLNYQDRLRAIEERAAVDLREAHARMRVVGRGLQVVYGLNILPVPALPSGEQDYPPSNLMEQTIHWIRATGLILQDLYARDQDVVFTLSIKDLLHSTAFRDGRESGSWTFDFPSGYLQHQRLVRLRGISASTRCESSRRYSIVVTPPTDVIMIHGPKWEGVKHRQHVDPCWISRIRDENSRRPPDVFGVRTLWNASPFGAWTIAAAPGTDFKELDDLLLSFNLTSQYL